MNSAWGKHASGRHYDGTGRPVPSYLEEAFCTRAQMEKWCARLGKLRATLAGIQLHQGALWLDVPACQRLLEQVGRLVVDAMPFTKCACSANEMNCEHCKGQRWVTAKRMPGRLGEVVASK